jgi:hypothetical protein
LAKLSGHLTLNTDIRLLNSNLLENWLKKSKTNLGFKSIISPSCSALRVKCVSFSFFVFFAFFKIFQVRKSVPYFYEKYFVIEVINKWNQSKEKFVVVKFVSIKEEFFVFKFSFRSFVDTRTVQSNGERKKCKKKIPVQSKVVTFGQIWNI